MKTHDEQLVDLYGAALRALCNEVHVYTEAGDNVELDLDSLEHPPGGTASVRAEAILALFNQPDSVECTRCDGDPGRCQYCGGTGHPHNYLEEE